MVRESQANSGRRKWPGLRALPRSPTREPASRIGNTALSKELALPSQHSPMKRSEGPGETQPQFCTG